MKNLYLVCIAAALLATKSTAQGLQLTWATSMGQAYFDEGESIAVDNQGNTFVYGTYSETETTNGPGGVQIITILETGTFLTKQDNTGQFLWLKKFANAMYEYHCSALVLDNAGNPIITGYFEDTVDFDPGVGTLEIIPQNGHESFVEKLDANGNLVWFKTMQPNAVNALAIDAANNLYFTGFYYGIVDFDPGVGSVNMSSTAMTSDAFLLKLDANGDFLFVRTLPSTGYGAGNNLVVSGDGSIYVSGSFAETLSYTEMGTPGSITSNGYLSTFITKYDAGGQAVWTKGLLSESEINADDMAVDGNGNIYLSGYFLGQTDFDPGAATFDVTNSSYFDAYLAKYDGQGNFSWFRRFAGNPTSAANGDLLAVTPQNTVFMMGSFTEAGLMTGINNMFAFQSNGMVDLYLLHLDENGELLNGKQLGGTGHDAINGITWHTGGLYLTGSYESSIDADPGATGIFPLTSQGQFDVFTIQLDGCVPTYGVDVVFSIQPYTWIDGFTYAQDNSIATYTLTNAQGCDSIVTLNLSMTSAGLSEASLDELVNIYPNPVQDVLVIDSEIAGSVRLMDATGRMVLEFKKETPQSEMNVANLAAGYYTLIFENEQGLLTKQIVVQ